MNNLTKQTPAEKALSNLTTFEQIKEFGVGNARLVEALKGWKGREDEYYTAFEGMIRAYHIIGTELAKILQHGGDRRSSSLPTENLKSLGITGKQSHEWQTIALIPLTVIDDYLIERRAEAETVSKADLLRIAEKYKTADKICAEQSEKVVAAMNVFCLNAKHFIDHLKEFPDSRKTVPKYFFETLGTFKELTDHLERLTM